MKDDYNNNDINISYNFGNTIVMNMHLSIIRNMNI